MIPYSLVAVMGLDKYAILAAFEPRLARSREQEIETAVGQIARIAWLRLSALLS